MTTERATTERAIASDRILATTADLRVAVTRVYRRIRFTRAEDDLSIGEISALFVLLNEGTQTLSTLSEAERVTLPSMSRIVTKLHRRGYVVRDPDVVDRRQVNLSITEAGRQAALATRHRRETMIAEVLAAMTDEDLAALERAIPLLQRLADS